MVVVNGESHEVTAPTLAGVLRELGFQGEFIATALNSEFVPAAQRETTPIRHGEALEIVAPMQGG